MQPRNDMTGVMSSSVPVDMHFPQNQAPFNPLPDLMSSIDSCLSQEAGFGANIQPEQHMQMSGTMAAHDTAAGDAMFEEGLFDIFGQGGIILDSDGATSDGNPASPEVEQDVPNSEMEYESQAQMNSYTSTPSDPVEMITSRISQTLVYSPQTL